MKTKKSISLALLSTATALVLLTPGVFAASPQPLNMSISGMITNAGSQHYSIAGSHLVYGSYDGVPLSGPVNYRVDATVSGLNTSGKASISLGEGSQSMKVSVQINGEIPAAVFPLTQSLSNCISNCNSEIPLLFTGLATISGHGDSSPTTLPVAIESAYWNPFGGPILITSLSQTNPTLLLVVTYNMATIDWSQVVLEGAVSGTLGSAAITGGYATVTNSHENLVAGTEQDSGQIFLTEMSASSLNAAGKLSGTTTFTLAGSFDCSSLFGLPEGTCTATGASSSGNFQMTDATGGKIVGSYSTQWSVPSLFTTTTAIAQVTK
ncbi:MAG: hypothetical protein JRN12_08025 [Nitrososphaerota archaeon]|jgi:hypothetical protein|nr:hypothetical protein [Nitrososphaerota archaeon]